MTRARGSGGPPDVESLVVDDPGVRADVEGDRARVGEEVATEQVGGQVTDRHAAHVRPGRRGQQRPRSKNAGDPGGLAGGEVSGDPREDRAGHPKAGGIEGDKASYRARQQIQHARLQGCSGQLPGGIRMSGRGLETADERDVHGRKVPAGGKDGRDLQGGHRHVESCGGAPEQGIARDRAVRYDDRVRALLAEIEEHGLTTAVGGVGEQHGIPGAIRGDDRRSDPGQGPPGALAGHGGEVLAVWRAQSLTDIERDRPPGVGGRGERRALGASSEQCRG
ncbi:MAG: hypothetical protein IPH03_00930 [Tetrasphaera sp.]|nr:hypothetical protein [Tetrasphaera sp.]